MSCEAARRLIQGKLDGDLLLAEEEALRAHLSGCEACARDAAALEGVVAALETLPPMPAPEALLSRLKPELDRLSRRPKAWRWAVPGAIAAGLVAALSLAQFQAGGPASEQVATEPPSAQEILEWVDASADPVDFTF